MTVATSEVNRNAHVNFHPTLNEVQEARHLVKSACASQLPPVSFLDDNMLLFLV